MLRSPLPAGLGSTFTVAHARDIGVSPSRLRAADLHRPYRGLRTSVSVGAKDPDVRGTDLSPTAAAAVDEMQARALLLARTMPDTQFFSHVTAAVLWGIPLPGSALIDPELHLRALDVGVFAPLRHPRHAGVAGHQVRASLAHVVVHPMLNVRLASPASTWAMLGSVLFDGHDLVAAGDATVREPMFDGDPPPLATLEHLRAAVQAGRRVGGPALREALERVRTRSASRMETRCRLLLIDAHLPEPGLNVDVFDPLGLFVACVDLAYPTLKIAIEYEGEHHLRDPEQWARDIRRHERLAELGWVVIRVTKRDVFAEPRAFVERVRRAIRSRTA